MGYPMTYERVVGRNALRGDYAQPTDPSGVCMLPTYHHTCQCGATRNHVVGLIAGDLRRLERDQRDEAHVNAYARIAGITPEQAKTVLDAFFNGVPLTETLDLGEGGTAIIHDEYHGLIWLHARPDNGEKCNGGMISWQGPDAWQLISREPLTLSPSLQCSACGRHGFIEGGKWRAV